MATTATREHKPDVAVAYSPDRCAEAYDIGRTKVYEAIATGKLRARKLGRRTIILRADADAWIKALPPVVRQ